MADGRLIFDTEINTKGFETDLSNLERKTNGLTGSIAKGNLLSRGLEKAGEVVFDVGEKSLMTSSKMQEVQNVINTTFGDNADSVREWAKTTKDNYGIAEASALKYAGQFGTFFKTAGLEEDQILEYSKNLVGLAGDLTSFWDNEGGITETLKAINSALRGETEAIENYGIDVRIAALSAFTGIEMEGASKQEQLEAIYGKLFADTTDMQGDFAKTSESFANQMRLFQTNIETLYALIGNKFLPAANSVLTFFNDLFEAGDQELTAVDQLEAVTEKWKDFETAVAEADAQFETSQQKIEAKAELAEGYLQTLESLEAKEVKTDQDVTAIQNAITALNNLYPQLELYFDPATGKINENTEAIRNNIAAIQNLAVQDLFAARLKENADAITAGYEHIVEAETQLAEANAPLEAVDAQITGLKNLMANLEETGFQSVEPIFAPYADLINGFDQYFEKNEAGGWVAKNGMMPDIGQVTNSAANALSALNIEREQLVQGIEEVQASIDSYNSTIEALVSEQAAIEEKQARVTELMNTAGQEASGEFAAGVEANSGAAENAISIMSSNAAESVDLGACNSAGGKMVSAVQAGIDAAPTPTINVRVNTVGSVSGINPKGSHATGLPYVPYDNYLANLHVGESVLTAAEARKWRSGEGSIDTGALVSGISAAISGMDNNRDIVINIDGRQAARIMAKHTAQAANNRSRSTALGVGK